MKITVDSTVNTEAEFISVSLADIRYLKGAVHSLACVKSRLVSYPREIE